MGCVNFFIEDTAANRDGGGGCGGLLGGRGVLNDDLVKLKSRRRN
jgi:hypothetical protein